MCSRCERCPHCGGDVEEFSPVWFEELERMIVAAPHYGIKLAALERTSLSDIRGLFTFLKNRSSGDGRHCIG